MTFEQFERSLVGADPPAGVSIYLQSLWYDGKGNWDLSHEKIQDLEDSGGAWIHAYLHRKEGDTGNADYWYRRAGKKRPAITLDDEWKELVKSFL